MCREDGTESTVGEKKNRDNSTKNLNALIAQQIAKQSKGILWKKSRKL